MGENYYGRLQSRWRKSGLTSYQPTPDVPVPVSVTAPIVVPASVVVPDPVPISVPIVMLVVKEIREMIKEITPIEAIAPEVIKSKRIPLIPRKAMKRQDPEISASTENAPVIKKNEATGVSTESITALPEEKS